ncbi:MAG: primosomal protein N' [Armatimonadetes bacterium]|nr:primosomal protein N' [Armatimonadota bacterium]MDW8120993.1 primosomal protein N' [Armatimonadota bacterium]
MGSDRPTAAPPLLCIAGKNWRIINGKSVMVFANVCLDIRSGPSELIFTYQIPQSLNGRVRVGSCVAVPLGERTAIGYVVSLTKEPPALPKGTVLKPIRKVLSEEPLFNETTVLLAKRIAHYYHSSLTEALQLFIPSGWQRSVEKRLSLVSDTEAINWLKRNSRKNPAQAAIVKTLLESGGTLSLEQLIDSLEAKLVKSLGRLLSELKGKKLIKEEQIPKTQAAQPRRLRAARLSPLGAEVLRAEEEEKSSPVRLTQEQKRLLWHLSDGVAVLFSDLINDGFSPAIVRRAAQKGLVEVTEYVPDRTWDQEAVGFSAPLVELNSEQESAVKAVTQALSQRRAGAPDWGRSEKDRVFLLHGVTASGKTEVYLRCMEFALSKGMGCLYLVPEIALTAQIVGILRSRFGEKVSVWHSALPASTRFQQWIKVKSGECPIVVGARSALFAPLTDIGLIVMDEEHDRSYKQEQGIRYHALEVARMQASLHRSVLLLGSATPSITSYYRSVRGQWNLLELKERVEGKPLPSVHIVDDRTAPHTFSPLFSDSLYQALAGALNKGQQVILFLNRRGYARIHWCESCGYRRQCPNCAVSLVYHSKDDRLHCHHCGHRQKPETRCPLCGSAMMVLRGYGTEQVYWEVRRLFPDHPAVLLDRDAIVSQGDHARILSSFRQGHYRVLVGTQMVTKGLDFPLVTVVGVLDADQALLFPHFRAAEETFQLLTQVAGRAGRGDEPGRVLIQTRLPHHYAIQLAIAQDFRRFFLSELKNRQHPPYPPYSFIAEMICADEDQALARQSIEEVVLAVKKAMVRLGPSALVDVLGPSECLIPRLKGRWRYHILLRSRKAAALHQILSATLPVLSSKTREILTVDVDPIRLE